MPRQVPLLQHCLVAFGHAAQLARAIGLTRGEAISLDRTPESGRLQGAQSGLELRRLHGP
eukprot:4039291-Amphidinium_carterae.1